MFVFSPLLGKEGLQQGLALSLPHSCCDLTAMVEGRKLEKIQCAARSAAFQIGRAIDNPRKTSMDHRAGAHWTRLFSDVQSAVDQPPVAHHFFRLGQRQHFGVGRGVFAPRSQDQAEWRRARLLPAKTVALPGV